MGDGEIEKGYTWVWWDIIFRGLLFSPWYIIKYCFTGCRTKYVCVPWKKYLSMNGKNLKVKAYLPFGLIELIAVAATFVMVREIGSTMKFTRPAVYAHAETLLSGKKGTEGCGNPEDKGCDLGGPHCYPDCESSPLRWPFRHPYWIGNGLSLLTWLVFANEQQNQQFQYLDKFQVNKLRKACTGEEMYMGKPLFDREAFGKLINGTYDPEDPVPRFKSYWDDITLRGDRSVNDAANDVCNFLTVSYRCVCVGVLDLDGSIHKACPGKSPPVIGSDGTIGKDPEAPGHGLCAKVPIGIRFFIDVNDFSFVYNNVGGLNRNILHIPLLLAIIRFGTLWADIIGGWIKSPFCRGELRKPGAQWLNGWPAGVIIFKVRGDLMKLKRFYDMRARHDYQKENDPEAFESKIAHIKKFRPYFRYQHIYHGYEPDRMKGRFYAHDGTLIQEMKGCFNWLLIAAICNILCSFISEQSYCNDFTTYAYSMENIKRVRRRDLKIAADRARKTRLSAI